MFAKIKGISIEGITAAAPSFVEDNMLRYADILGERRCRKQIRLTGIERRHISAPEQDSSDLAIEAARFLIDRLGWAPGEVRVLVYVTQKPAFRSPSTAFYIQKVLDIPDDCVVFDVNLGCSAAQVGVQVASALLSQLGVSGKGLVLCGFSTNMDEKGKKPEEQMLFGSAGGAIALAYDPSAPDIPFMLKSDGRRYEAIFRDKQDRFEMDGEQVFAFSVDEVTNDVQAFMRHFGIERGDVDFFAFHQAQKLILDTMMSALDVPPEKELRSLAEYGNTSGASSILTLCANTDRLAGYDRVRILTCGFGGGLSWCMQYMCVPASRIYPVIITDHVYDRTTKSKGEHDND